MALKKPYGYRWYPLSCLVLCVKIDMFVKYNKACVLWGRTIESSLTSGGGGTPWALQWCMCQLAVRKKSEKRSQYWCIDAVSNLQIDMYQYQTKAVTGLKANDKSGSFSSLMARNFSHELVKKLFQKNWTYSSGCWSSTQNKSLCCSVSAGRLIKQLFASSFAMWNLKGDNVSMLC